MKYSTTGDLTKSLMADALEELMREKPINKISVKELTDLCKLNRQTFYYHFSDIYELLEWLLKKNLLSHLTDTGTYPTWQDAGIYLLSYLKTNSSLVLSTLNSLSRNTIKSLLYDEIYKVAKKFIYELAGDIPASEAAFNSVSHYCSITFSALLEDWLLSGMQSTPEELIERLDIIVSGLARSSISRYAIKEGTLPSP